MAKAVVDPEELRAFAASLRRFVGALNGEMTSIQGRMASLGQTWRDQEHDKFAAEFDETMRALQRFTRAAEVHVPFLMRKAEAVEGYLNQR